MALPAGGVVVVRPWPGMIKDGVCGAVQDRAPGPMDVATGINKGGERHILAWVLRAVELPGTDELIRGRTPEGLVLMFHDRDGHMDTDEGVGAISDGRWEMVGHGNTESWSSCRMLRWNQYTKKKEAKRNRSKIFVRRRSELVRTGDEVGRRVWAGAR